MARVNVSQAEKARAQEVSKGLCERGRGRESKKKHSCFARCVAFFSPSTKKREGERQRAAATAVWRGARQREVDAAAKQRPPLCLPFPVVAPQKSSLPAAGVEGGGGEEHRELKGGGRSNGATAPPSLSIFSSWRHPLAFSPPSLPPFRQQLLRRQHFYGSASHLALESSGVCLLWDSNASKRRLPGSATRRFRDAHFFFFNLPCSKKKRKQKQLLQRGVVTRRAAAAAGLKVEDQVRSSLAFFFSFVALLLYLERECCIRCCWRGGHKEGVDVLLCASGPLREGSLFFERGGDGRR